MGTQEEAGKNNSVSGSAKKTQKLNLNGDSSMALEKSPDRGSYIKENDQEDEEA